MSKGQLTLAMIFFVQLGCAGSWKKTYESKGASKNLIIDVQLDGDGGLGSDWAELDVFEESNSCTLKYQGTLKLKNKQDNKVSLQKRHPLKVVFNRNQSRYFGNRISSDQMYFRIQPKTGYTYKLRYRERGTSSEALLLAKSSSSQNFKEVSSLPRANCPTEMIIK